MPEALARSRGAFLKARLAVNGIQSSSSESSPEEASGGGDMGWPDSPLGGRGATPPQSAALRGSGKDDQPHSAHDPLVDGLVGNVAGDPAASARAAHGPVLSDGEAHPGSDLHHRAESEVDAELE